MQPYEDYVILSEGRQKSKQRLKQKEVVYSHVTIRGLRNPE
jgi:hypothetical protein